MSKLSEYRSKPMEELSNYKTAPYNHGAYDWISQDGTRTNVQELDDSHLLNIYRILAKSISMAQEDIKIYQNTIAFAEQIDAGAEIVMDVALADTMENLDTFNEQIRYIGHEIYKRGLLINKFDKYIEV